MSRYELVEVFSSRAEAGVAKTYLESMGINTRIVADDADQLYPSISAVKGVKLLAKTEDLDKAKILLKDK